MEKKFVVILVALVFISSLAATTPLSKGTLVLENPVSGDATRDISTFPWYENFSEAPGFPAGWSFYNMDMAFYGLWEATEAVSHEDDNTGCMSHASTSEVNEDGWLITPALSLPANPGIALSFWSKNYYPDSYGANEVLVSNGSINPTSGDYVGIWMPFSVSGNWHQNYVDLSPWTGQTVYVAFRYRGQNAHVWNLDDVRVEQFSGFHDLPVVEDFESGVFPPYYWGYFDEDGQNTAWNWNNGNDHTEDGSCYAVHYSENTSEPEDDWLTTPRIFLPEGSAYSLSFWSLNYYSDQYAENGVYVSTGAVEPGEGQFAQIWSPLTVEESWVKSYVDLSPWAGQSVHIAFRYYGLNAHEWRLDDVRVEEYQGITEFPYRETFESGVFPPYYWTSYDVDGSGTYWSWNQEFNHTDGGTCSAMHIWDADEPSEDGWLVSPKLRVPPEAELQLTFWSQNINPYWYGYNGVWVSTGSPDPFDGDYQEVWNPLEVEADWVHSVVDLSDFAGQDIFVAFRYQGFDAHDWYLDDVVFSLGGMDLIPPEITHLPLLNTTRDDLPLSIYAEAQDDPFWNSGISGVWVYYKINEGDWVLLNTEPQGDGYYGEIPPQPLGTQIDYVVVACDASPQYNFAYSQGYRVIVDDPAWLYYDSLQEGIWAGVTLGDWGLGVLFSNPEWGSGSPLQIRKVSGALLYSDSCTLQVFSAQDENLAGLSPIMDPLTVNFNADQWIDVNLEGVSVSSPYFYVVWDNIDTSNCFPLDMRRYYPNRNYLIWDGANLEMGAGPQTYAVWMVRVMVESSQHNLGPVLTIINTSEGPELHWTEVPGAQYYNVYAADNPSAPEPWSLFDSTEALGLGALGDAQRNFFRVCAYTSERIARQAFNAIQPTTLPAGTARKSQRVLTPTPQ